MDGAGALNVQVAYAKAITAIGLGEDTIQLRYTLNQKTGVWDRTEGWSDHDLANARQLQATFVSWAGGLQVEDSVGTTIGAVGISGRLELEDHSLAREVMMMGWDPPSGDQPATYTVPPTGLFRPLFGE